MRTLVLGVAAAALAGGTVSADDTAELVPANIRGKLAGTVARLTFEYRFDVERGTDNLRVLGIAPGSTVIGATVVSPSRHELGLLPADEGAERFEAIRQRQAGKSARWSVLISSEGGSSVDVAIGAPAKARVTLELATEHPTCFHQDARYFAVPVAWAGALAPELRAIKVDHHAVSEACGDPGEQIWIGFPSRELARRRSGVDRVGSTAGRAVFGEMHVAKLELGVARRLGDVPADLATAILVDASRSLSADERATQRELVAAYLRATPNSRVQVIAYDRFARGLLPAWTAASHAAARIERELAALPGANGSNLDAGLAEAARWLAKTSGTRRIVVVTDERLANRFGDEPSLPLAKLVPRGVLLHAVVAHGDADYEPSRNDYSVLAPLALGTTGFAIETGRPRAGIDATLLARPLSVDHLEIDAQGWKAILPNQTRPCGDGLVQGAGCAWWGHGDVASGDITVRGSVWGQKLVRVIKPDSSRTVEIARELGSHPEIDDTLRDAAAPHAHAVNRAWSLYAEWGSQFGYGEDIIRGACGCLGLRSIGTSSHTSGVGYGHTTRKPLPPLDLEPQLARVHSCGLGSHRVTAEIENTLDEIVDVTVTVAPDPSSTPLARQSLRDCVAERIWETQISVPATHPHATTRVVFGD